MHKHILAWVAVAVAAGLLVGRWAGAVEPASSAPPASTTRYSWISILTRRLPSGHGSACRKSRTSLTNRPITLPG